MNIAARLVLLVLRCSIALRLLSAPSRLWLGLLGPIAALSALGLLASRNLIGCGDAKLVTAVSVAVPADRLLTRLLAITLAGGLLSCLYLASCCVLRPSASSSGRTRPDLKRLSSPFQLADRERARILTGEPMPYAAAIFGSGVFILATG